MAVIKHIKNLGLEPSVSLTKDQIKEQYKKYSLFFHPDKHTTTHTEDECFEVQELFSKSDFFAKLDKDKCVNADYTKEELEDIQSVLNHAKDELTAEVRFGKNFNNYNSNYFQTVEQIVLHGPHNHLAAELRSAFETKFKSIGFLVHLNLANYKQDVVASAKDSVSTKARKLLEKEPLQADLLEDTQAEFLIANSFDDVYEKVGLEHFREKVCAIKHAMQPRVPCFVSNAEHLQLIGQGLHDHGLDHYV